MTCRIEGGVTYTHTYNAENRASSIAKRTGDCTTGTILESWSFAYDGDGVRVMTAHFTGTSGTPDSTTSYFMGGAYEVKDSAVKKYYSIAGMMVATQDASGLQYLLTDHLGSTVAVTNSSGTLTSQQRYLPFGGTRAIPNSPILGTDYGYTGQRLLDSGMGGIMDYKARFYSVGLGRFLQPDTIIPDNANPQSWNRFSYVQNQPIIYSDPDGHVPFLLLAAVFVIGAFVMTGSVQQPATYGPPAPNPWGDNEPDGKFTSVNFSIAGKSKFWTGGVDIINTKKETGIFLTNSVKDPTSCECSTLNKKITFMIPNVSVSINKGVLFGDDLKEDVKAYSGTASVISGGMGNWSGEAFSSTDKTAKRTDKVVGIGAGFGLGFCLWNVCGSSYYTNSKVATLFGKELVLKKFWAK
jgi:RHS repeat-associated protein